jgi:hypothetical protein
MPAGLHDLTIAEASDLIRARRLSPLELVNALIRRVEDPDAQTRAFITPTFDLARRQAKVAEAEIVAGRHRGPLHGIPFALKDIYDTRGILTSGHSRVFANRISHRGRHGDDEALHELSGDGRAEGVDFVGFGAPCQLRITEPRIVPAILTRHFCYSVSGASAAPRCERRRPPQEWVERRRRGWCASRLAPLGVHRRTARLGYRFRDGAPPGSKCQRRMLGRRLGDVKITTQLTRAGSGEV